MIKIRQIVWHFDTITWVCLLLVQVLRLNNAWASGSVLRPFLQPESPLSSQEFGLRLQVQAFVIRTRNPHTRGRAL